MNTQKIAYTNIATGDLKFAADYLDEELEKLLCLSICLTNRLEPKNPKEPTDEEDTISWNLARVLCERLERKDFSDSMRSLLQVNDSSETA